MNRREPFDQEEAAWAERLARLPSPEPSADLDARVLALARAAAMPQRRRPRWGWGMGAAAAAMLTVAVFAPLWQAEQRAPMLEAELAPPVPAQAPAADDRDNTGSTSASGLPATVGEARREAADAPDAAAAKAAMPQAQAVPALQAMPTDERMRLRDAPAAPAPAPAPAPPPPPARAAPAAPPPQAFPAAPMAAQKAHSVPAEPSIDAAPTMPSPVEELSVPAPLQERDAGFDEAMEAEPRRAGRRDLSADPSLADAGEDEDAQSEWQDGFRRLRALLDQGRLDEARAVLAELRRRHPRLVLPEDLRHLDAGDSP